MAQTSAVLRKLSKGNFWPRLKRSIKNPRQALWKAYRYVRPLRRDYRQRYKMNLEKWLVYHQREITYDQCYWMGVKNLGNPLDNWIYQEIIWEVKPDFIVEIGSAHGGSTLYLAHLLELVGNGQVISIDIDRSNYVAKHARIIELTGNSSSPEIVSQVQQLCEGKRVLVIHDGDHHKEQVLRDLAAYAPLVNLGSYVIVEDGIVDLFKPQEMNWKATPGPLAATEEFLAHNPAFEIDTARERYIITYNPKGFLKRVKE